MSYFSAQNDAKPIVVQGQLVSAYEQGKFDYTHKEPTTSSPHHERKGGCRDAFWAILFYCHLGLMGYLALVFCPQAASSAYEQYGDGGGGRTLEEGGNDGGFSTQDISIDPRALIILTGLSGFLGCVVSSLAMGFMMRFAETLIKTALVFNVIIFAFMALGSLLTGMLPGALMGLLLCGFAAYYAYAVWGRVPVCLVLFGNCSGKTSLLSFIMYRLE